MIFEDIPLARDLTNVDFSDLTDATLLETPRWTPDGDLEANFSRSLTDPEARHVRRRLITPNATREAWLNNVLRLRVIVADRVNLGIPLSEVPESAELLMLLMQGVVPELFDPSSQEV